MSRILVACTFLCLVVLAFARSAAAQDAAAPAEEAADATAEAAAGAEPAAEEPAAEEAPAEEAPAEEQPAEEAAAPAPSPEAVAENEAFEALVSQWNDLVEQLKDLQPQRDQAQGEARAALDAQMQELRRQTAGMATQIAQAGLAVYKADSQAFPRVNSTLLAIIQFFVIGDPKGDGGDQYERALPLIKELIDLGGGEKWPQLYMLGGMSAYCIGELDLAEEYLTRAKEEGFFDNVPPQSPYDPPAVKLVQQASMYLEGLPTHREHWEAEQKIRAAEAEADDLPRVRLTTTKGDIVIELFENEAPQSVANFITLVKKGFYDGVVFHRVLPLFMAQGGDPEGTGGGGPGYNIPDEQGAENARLHFRGSLSMANTGNPNTGGSQFFLTFVPTSYLDGAHAVFGRVAEGMDVAASLTRRDPDGPPPSPTPDKILKATVERDRGHAYEFEQLPE
jgi:cyclophilin family peptidyl-prolyl cis-trans isomerase